MYFAMTASSQFSFQCVSCRNKNGYDEEKQFQKDTIPQLGHDHLLAYISGALFISQHNIRSCTVRRPGN